MGSLGTIARQSIPPAQDSPFERRLRAEWDLLVRLTAHNPGRLADPQAEDTTFSVTLQNTPALRLPLQGDGDTLQDDGLLQDHRLRIIYPRYFPALPLELFLDRPVLHPNIHPATGFACLWDRHRVSNTVEHAIHKTAAMLGWKLLNFDPGHTMQPQTRDCSPAQRQELVKRLEAPALRGVTCVEPFADMVPTRRRRLQ